MAISILMQNNPFGEIFALFASKKKSAGKKQPTLVEEQREKLQKRKGNSLALL